MCFVFWFLWVIERRIKILDALIKLRKATISFVMSVRPSVRIEQLVSYWTGFHEIWYLSIFRKKILRIFKFHKNVVIITGLYMKTDIHFWSYLAQFFLGWEMFQTQVVEKIKINILCSITFIRNSCHLWDVGKRAWFKKMDSISYVYTKRWTQFCTSIFPELSKVYELST